MTSPDFPGVTIVIPHHNGPHLLRDCLASLDELDYPRERSNVILVDDASTDDSVRIVESEFPRVKICRNESNQGFAASCNRGVREAETDWVAFLNNDTRVDPGWLRGLTDCVAPENGIMAAASKILDWEGKRVTFQGGHLSFTGKGFENACPRGSEKELMEPRELLFGSGCAMLVHRDTFLFAGGFDEQFFGFYEDTDFGWRLRLFGYRIRLAPASVAFHRGHASFDAAGKERRLALIERNSLWQILKNLGDKALSRILPAALLLAVRRNEILCGEKGGGSPPPLHRRLSAAWESLTGVPPGRTSMDAVIPAFAAFSGGIGDILAKRAEIQSRRKVPDREILTPGFFPEPRRVWALDEEMMQALRDAGYPETLHEVASAFRIDEVFQTGG